MKIKIENVEIRGHEVKESKQNTSKYIVVRFDDDTGERFEILDRDMSREGIYKRGTVGDIIADLKTGRTKDGGSYANLSVVDFIEKEGD